MLSPMQSLLSTLLLFSFLILLYYQLSSKLLAISEVMTKVMYHYVSKNNLFVCSCKMNKCNRKAILFFST